MLRFSFFRATTAVAVWALMNFLMKMLLRLAMPAGGGVICCRGNAFAASGLCAPRRLSASLLSLGSGATGFAELASAGESAPVPLNSTRNCLTLLSTPASFSLRFV